LEEAGGIRYLVLQLVPGETLARRLAAGPLEIGQALRCCAQVAEALESAHEKGIMHRDLKPANINITPEGKVKVLDFGLAKTFHPQSHAGPSQAVTVTKDLTRAGMVVGTAAYMSPEQARGKPLDKRTDIWSFGCVLYEALTQRKAFPGETASDSLAAILRARTRLGSAAGIHPGERHRLAAAVLGKGRCAPAAGHWGRTHRAGGCSSGEPNRDDAGAGGNSSSAQAQSRPDGGRGIDCGDPDCGRRCCGRHALEHAASQGRAIQHRPADGSIHPAHTFVPTDPFARWNTDRLRVDADNGRCSHDARGQKAGPEPDRKERGDGRRLRHGGDGAELRNGNG